MTAESASGTGYFASDAEATDERARLSGIEAGFDAHTFRYFDGIGVGEGWRCFEVGAGAGSVVRWLSERVGPTGRVVAADVDPRFICDLTAPNIEVRRFDITRDDIEPDYYNLIHCRLLLVHLDDPPGTLRRMADALQPGGWVVAEEFDNPSCLKSVDPAHPLAEVFDSSHQRWVDFLIAAGIMNPALGKLLPAHVDDIGLVHTGNMDVSRECRGGDRLSRWWIQTWAVMRDTVIANGVVSESELADVLRAFEDPTFRYRGYRMQSIWGRKPWAR